MPDTVVILTPDLKILDATDEYYRITMRTREELVGQDFLDSFPDNPDDPSSRNAFLLRKSLEKVLETKQPDRLEVLRYDIPRPASAGGGYDVRFWEAIHAPIPDEKGNVSYIIQKTSDVTERELSKHALALEESKFRFMADAMPQLIFTTNPEGKLTYLNQRWEQYTGEPITNLFGDKWQETIHPEDQGAFAAKWKEALQQGTEMQAELRQRDKNGNYRWHLCRSMPMHTEQGELTMWVGSYTDIHDTRNLVMELLATNEQMVALSDQVHHSFLKAEAERKVMEQLILKAPFFCCILKGPEHRYELVNENYQKLIYNRDSVGKTVAEVIPEVVEQGFIQILDKVYTTGEDFLAEAVPIKLAQVNTNELQQYYLTFIYQALRDENGNIHGILVFGYDVSDQERYRQKLQDLELSQ
ncbi:PAS domain-containing protein [Pontibacter qinzhouensis]|uniref:PAS domain-containing protein n=1 Tax=Pontibacter qinzhouensis TaxID=2603253 RepID=UPI002105BFA3|nr:PAS domain-containing protein [Pontibacter qinzhouensis]